jgi:hypothetical protein
VIGTPLSERSRANRKWPTAAVTTYDAAGSSRCQVVTVLPSTSSRDSSTPLATPTHGAGVLMVKS